MSQINVGAAAVRQRILRGLGANAFGQIVTVIVQLIGVPILLRSWGAQLYGEWLILFAIPSYLSMTDLGFTQSAANDMTARVARGDRDGALAVFQSLNLLVYAVVALGAVTMTIIMPWLPLSDWLHFKAMDTPTAQWVLWLLAAQVFANLPNGIAHAGFRASGEYALHVGLNSVVRLVQFTGSWLAALAGAGPVAAAAVFMLVRLIATAGFNLWLVRRHRWLHYGLAHAGRSELDRLLRPALANMAIPLAQALNIQGMVVVVGIVLGPLAVVVFSTLRTLTRLAMQLVLTISLAVEPELAVAHGANDSGLMRALFIQTLRGGLWLALTAAVGLAICGNFILEHWTHGRVVMQPALYGWLLASAVASVLWYGALTVLKAANRHLNVATIYVLASAIAVAVATFLMSKTGSLAAAGLALLIMDMIMTIYCIIAASPLINSHPLENLALALNPFPMLKVIQKKLIHHKRQ